MGPSSTHRIRTVLRNLLALLLAVSGTAHLLRPASFLGQVPSFLPARTAIVYVSGVVELVLAFTLVLRRTRRWAGLATAGFLVVIFPGNIWQAVAQTPAFGLTTDAARLVRLLFQPVFIVVALWSTGNSRNPLRGRRRAVR